MTLPDDTMTITTVADQHHRFRRHLVEQRPPAEPAGYTGRRPHAAGPSRGDAVSRWPDCVASRSSSTAPAGCISDWPRRRSQLASRMTIRYRNRRATTPMLNAPCDRVRRTVTPSSTAMAEFPARTCHAPRLPRLVRGRRGAGRAPAPARRFADLAATRSSGTGLPVGATGPGAAAPADCAVPAAVNALRGSWYGGHPGMTERRRALPGPKEG